MTNNSIFTRVLSLVLCVMMFAGVFTSCFQMPQFKPTLGTQTQETPNAGTTTDRVENTPTDDPVKDPIEDPVEPDPVDPTSFSLDQQLLQMMHLFMAHLQMMYSSADKTALPQ